MQAGESIALKNASNAVAHYIENPGFKHEVPKGQQLKSHVSIVWTSLDVCYLGM